MCVLLYKIEASGWPQASPASALIYHGLCVSVSLVLNTISQYTCLHPQWDEDRCTCQWNRREHEHRADKESSPLLNMRRPGRSLSCLDANPTVEATADLPSPAAPPFPLGY